MNAYSAKPKSHAFTLIELTVIIVVLGVLACLWVAAAMKNSGQIKRAQCASNLQQFNLAMQIYGNEYGGRLPPMPSGAWAWDTPWTLGAFIESTGSKWSIMYCPGTGPFFTDADNLLLFNFAPNAYRVTGYASTFSGSSVLISTNVNATLLPEPIQISFGVFTRPLPSERVLLADATISDFGQNNQALQFSSTYRYTLINGGFIKPHSSPHLNGRFPAGGNIGMLDGHVAWRQFKDMQPRTTGASPGMWW